MARRGTVTTLSAIGMAVQYKSGDYVGKTGIIENERIVRSSHKEFFVRWSDGMCGWYMASNLKF